VDGCHRLGRDLGEVVELAPLSRMTEIVGQTLCAPVEAADSFAERLWARYPGDARVVALVIRLAPKLAIERMLDWSSRLRAAGFPERCPLVEAVRDRGRPASERVLAAALAYGVFGDDRALLASTDA